MAFAFAHSSFDQELLEEINRATWHHRIELAEGFYTNSRNDVARKLNRTRVPQDLRGATCLDVGTRDGGLAFEMEKRGAQRVIANDYVEKTHFNFELARRCIGSKVEFVQADMYTLPFLKMPKFDVINYSGVIYHVADPYLSLMAMRELCKPDGLIVVESALLDGGSYSLERRVRNKDSAEIMEAVGKFDNLLQYLPRGHVNSWVPSKNALRSLCEDAGLEIVQEATWGDRVSFSAKIVRRPRFPSLYQQVPVSGLLRSREPGFS